MTDENSNKNAEESTTPKVSCDHLIALLSEIYGLKGGSIEQLQGYDDLNYHFRPNVSCNSFIKTPLPSGYVLKIMNSLDSQKNDLCEAQNALMLFLREHNIPSPIPVQTMRGDFYQKIKLSTKTSDKETQREHIIRVLEFQCGTVLKQTPKSYPLFYKLGMFLGNLDNILKDFWHPVYETHYSIWHLSSAPEIKFTTHVIENPQRKELAEKVIEKYIESVQKKLETLEKGMIHGDFNENNVLLEKGGDGQWEVSALLDFGDSHHSYYLFELAVALCYMMFECKSENLNPVVGAGHFVAGYFTIRPTFRVNCELLKLCICARACQSLVLGLKTFKLYPENKYVLSTQERGWSLLKELWDTSEEEITKQWKSVIRSYDLNADYVLDS